MTVAARVEPQPTGVSLVREKVSSILLADDAKKHIAPLLPHGISLERVVSTIYQCAAENPEILECTPASIIMAVGKGVKWDLEFGETVYLVPFNVNAAKKGEAARWEKRAKAIRDYKGDIELVKASGAAQHVDAQCFYEKEHFVYHQGTQPFIEHHPIATPSARGAMVGAYGWAVINQRTPVKISVMSVEEIDAIRQAKSQSWKSGPLPDWYARKTMVHQVTKSLPKNPRLSKLLRDFEEEEIPDGEFEIVPENGSVPATSPEAPKQEPAAADDDPSPVFEAEPDLNEMTLEEAMTVALNGPPTSWNGLGGALISSFKTPHIEKIRTWSIKRIEEKGEDLELEKIATACSLILEARAKDQTNLDLLKPPTTSTNIKMPPPGKVVDAIKPAGKMPF